MLRYFGILSALILCSCSITSWIDNPQIGEKLDISVFSLVYHKQLGTCTAGPITHRYMTFEVGSLEKDGDNVFYGILDVLLNEASATYEAVYYEYPGVMNDSQVIYTENLSGRFEVVKAQDRAQNDSLILENIGEVYPTILSNKVAFTLKLENSIHRNLGQNEVLGRVQQGKTRMRPDNCP